MKKRKVIPVSLDLNRYSSNQSNYFFLEHLLKARVDLNLETGHHVYDQEVNVYIAGLLNSLIASNSFLYQKPYISSFDIDVRNWIESHPGYRNEYIAYRDNADFGLVFLGFFLRYDHRGSYQHLVMPESDEQNRLALYYEFAASALQHLQGRNNSLINVFYALAESISETLQIIRQASTTYFDMMERLSEGSMFHLEKEIDNLEMKQQYQNLIDDFLKTYSQYKENPSEEIKMTLKDLTGKLKQINSSFHFDV